VIAEAKPTRTAEEKQRMIDELAARLKSTSVPPQSKTSTSIETGSLNTKGVF